jgi:hypothetical protein
MTNFVFQTSSCQSQKVSDRTPFQYSNVLLNRRRCDKSLSDALHEAEPDEKTSSTLQNQGQLTLVQLSNAVPQLRRGNKMHLPPLTRETHLFPDDTHWITA